MPNKKSAGKVGAAKATTQKSVAANPSNNGITASIQAITLQPGLYLFSVRSGAPARTAGPGGLRLPSLQVSPAPGIPADRVQLIPSQNTNSNWLTATGDLLVAKVHAPAATVVLTSVRAPGSPELAVKVERLTGSSVGAEQPRAATAQAIAAPVAAAVRSASDGLRLQVGAHVRGRGDMNFVEALWAGRIGKGYWIESFSVSPLETLSRQDVEYKGLTASGFESPWLSDGVPCGTRGMAIPLIGFAVRLKANAGDGAYDCEYSGYFQSGVVVGPLRNGTPCRSTIANDPLEGLQVRILKKTKSGEAAPQKILAPRTAPSFGKSRDDEEAPARKRIVARGKSKISAKNKAKTRR